jgi:Zn-dependent protease with chaperone function
MTEQNKRPLLCRNGHKQPAYADKFCVHCGVSLDTEHPEISAPDTRQLNQSANPQALPPSPNQPRSIQQQQPNSSPARANQYPASPPAQAIQQMPVQRLQAMDCYVCGGNGQGLNDKTIICKECSWLRPLVPGYQVDSSTFEWAADGKAMSALRAIKPLNAAAQAVSEKVGRRWIESTFNGVLLGEKQLPQIYGQAVRAARILGMSHMPDIYLSGERAWDCLTFGTDRDSFILIGSALAGNFQGPDLLFLLAREIGHCRAGHALWKTVIRFFLGDQGPGKGVMAGGVFNAILNPTALITGAVEVPLLAWARQAEITADRAGLLTVGDEEVARRVLLSWSLKSLFLYRQINIEAWLEQQAADDEGYSKLSELTTSSTPYITPRLKLLTEFAKSRELKYWRKIISDSIQQAEGKGQAPPPKAELPAPNSRPAPASKAPSPADVLKIKCATCQTVMLVPLKVLNGKDELPVKCPNKKCGKITRLKKTIKPPAVAAPENVARASQPKKTAQPKKKAAKLKKNEENLNYVD